MPGLYVLRCSVPGSQTKQLFISTPWHCIPAAGTQRPDRQTRRPTSTGHQATAEAAALPLRTKRGVELRPAAVIYCRYDERARTSCDCTSTHKPCCKELYEKGDKSSPSTLRCLQSLHALALHLPLTWFHSLICCRFERAGTKEKHVSHACTSTLPCQDALPPTSPELPAASCPASFPAPLHHPPR